MTRKGRGEGGHRDVVGILDTGFRQNRWRHPGKNTEHFP